MRILNYQGFLKEEEKEEFTIDELSGKAKENALEFFRDAEIEGIDWEDPIKEGFIEDMKEVGVRVDDIYYSGFYSQGDGACFVGEVEDNELFLSKCLGFETKSNKILKKKLEIISNNIQIQIYRNNSRYFHENTIAASVDVDEHEEDLDIFISADLWIPIDLDKEGIKIEEETTEWARNESRKLYRKLENYFDELQSDESVKEYLRNRRAIFDRNGNLIEMKY
jgi:hypothetical protein